MSWPKVKLGDCCEVIMGQSPPSSHVGPDLNGTPFLTTGEFGDRFPKLIRYTTKPLKVAKEGDVLITVVGNVGGVNLGVNCAIGRSVAALRPKTDQLEQYFLYYLMRYFGYRLSHQARGAIQKIIRKEHLTSILIDLPPLEEQRRIAAILDKADEVERETARIQEMRDEIIRSTFQDIFGDVINIVKNHPIKDLSKLTTKINDGEHGTVEKTSAGRLYLMARNITRSNKLSLDNISFISQETHERIFKRCNPEYGDLLLVCVGATIGKATLVPKIEEFSLARSVALIKPRRDVLNPIFLLYLALSDFVQMQIEAKKRTAAQSGLYIKQIKSLQIPTPPIELQNQFADIVHQITAMDLSALETQATTLKQALTQELLA